MIVAKVSDWMFDLFFGEQERRAAQRHAEIIKALNNLTKQGVIMAKELEALEVEVARNTAVDQSAIALLTGLAQKIEDMKNDPVKLQALADEMRGSSDALAAAVVAHTPAEPAPA